MTPGRKNMQNKRSCPICHSCNSKMMVSFNLKTFDGYNLPLNVQVSECKVCGFVFNDQAIDEQTLNQFYTKENFYYSESSYGTGGADLARYQKYLEFLDPFIHYDGVIVDIGCGKGQFVKYLIDNGFPNACGVDLDKSLVSIATKQGIPVYEGSAFNLSLQTNSINLLIYTNVFEHLLNLDDTIQEVIRYLNYEGLLFIEVPDAAKYSKSRIFDFFWLSTIEHINHFSREYLEGMMKNNGFDMIVTSETIMPYNNPQYGYPSLRMLFQKNRNNHAVLNQFIYNGALRNEMQVHIKREKKFLARHRNIINHLVNSQTKLYVWGIGREFFILASLTDLLSCNIQALIDKNPDKHQMTVDGIKIYHPDYLKLAGKNSTVLLTSVFNKIQMQEYLSNISYEGSVLFIDGE